MLRAKIVAALSACLVIVSCSGTGTAPEEGKTVDELLAEKNLRKVEELNTLIAFDIHSWIYINRENVVLRVLDCRGVLRDLADLGLGPHDVDAFDGAMVRLYVDGEPDGMAERARPTVGAPQQTTIASSTASFGCCAAGLIGMICPSATATGNPLINASVAGPSQASGKRCSNDCWKIPRMIM